MLLADLTSTAPAAGLLVVLPQAALLCVLLVLSGVFSGSEAVLFSLSRPQLEQFRAAGGLQGLAARLMSAPKRTLMTILVGNTSVNVLLYATAYVLFSGLAARIGAWFTPAASLASILLVVVCGEVVPKVVGVQFAERLAGPVALFIHSAGLVLAPVGWLLDALIVEPLSRVIFGGSRDGGSERDISPDELKALLEMSRRSGVINRLEDNYLREVIDLRSVQVCDVMTPRVEVTGFDVHGDPEALRRLMRETRVTKVPVYSGDIDNVVGLIYAKMLFFAGDKPLKEVVSPVRFVPELITCEQLLEHFRATRSQFAVVVNEFGGTAGLVTLKDVLGRIVGNMHEGQAPETPEILRLSEQEYEVSGTLDVRYWAQTFGVSHLRERVSTIGGLVTARLGRAARPGDAVRLANLELRVLSVHHRRVERLRVRIVEPRLPEAEATP